MLELSLWQGLQNSLCVLWEDVCGPLSEKSFSRRHLGTSSRGCVCQFVVLRDSFRLEDFGPCVGSLQSGLHLAWLLLKNSPPFLLPKTQRKLIQACRSQEWDRKGL